MCGNTNVGNFRKGFLSGKVNGSIFVFKFHLKPSLKVLVACIDNSHIVMQLKYRRGYLWELRDL